ncbi:TetR family transcriptional regulator [Nocardioides panacisoli]|uniref:TetR family transcriptional regulator n=1 Tax=Nocardioides panacisoli TaxID=627624 RepID=UPI001C62C060|nr:TetR family transcriptional regulator [Nocardioides panacisoli]QYJ05658.1 TetR family transcriptional regulator [Nocardioides panacisoli]
MTETRVERKERTRRAILDAALDLSQERALVALSLRQVAKEVGIVPTAFYRHFDSIDALGLALVEESFATLREMLRDVRRQGTAEAGDMIDSSVAVLVDHVRRRDRHFAFIARERFAGPPAVRAEIDRNIEIFERELATDLAHQPVVGEWSDADLRTLANLIVSVLVVTTESLVKTGSASSEERALVDQARTQLRMLLIGALGWKSRP